MVAVANPFEAAEVLVERVAQAAERPQRPLVVKRPDQDRGTLAQVRKRGGGAAADAIGPAALLE